MSCVFLLHLTNIKLWHWMCILRLHISSTPPVENHYFVEKCKEIEMEKYRLWVKLSPLLLGWQVVHWNGQGWGDT